MTGQGADRQTSVVQCGKKFVRSFFAGEQLVKLDMAAAGPPSRAKFESLDMGIFFNSAIMLFKERVLNTGVNNPSFTGDPPGLDR